MNHYFYYRISLNNKNYLINNGLSKYDSCKLITKSKPLCFALRMLQSLSKDLVVTVLGFLSNLSAK